MAGFDFVDAATKGYSFFWREREAIARMAVPLFLVKFICYISVIALSLEENLLRQGLIYLPAYFVEAWLLVQLTRHAMLGERWPMMRTPENFAALMPRTRAIKAGIAVYVLIKLFLIVTSGLTSGAAPAPGTELPEPTLMTFIAAMVALGAMIWAFRLIWLYIPAALGYRVTDFIDRAGGYTTSFYMIGTWLICLLPPAMAVIFLSEMLVTMSGGEAGGALKVLLVALQVAVEIVISVITTIGMAHAVRAIMTGDTGKN
jgi:hypothetical protein